MALVTADRVRETTAVVGTGPATLLGAASGFQSFAVVGTGNTCYYCIADQIGTEWEVGLGTYNAFGPTLTRTTVMSSSNANAAVSFIAGTKDIFITYPAEFFPALAVQAAGGTHTSGTVSFANSNGVSFGLNAGTMTASVATNYLTTAMQSGASSAFAGTGFTSASTVGTAIVATHNTAGLSMGIPAFLTAGGGGGGGGVAVQVSNTTYTSGTITFQNANGISFGSSGAGGISASYTVPVQSQQPMYYSGANGSGSSNTMVFANSNGVSFSTGTQGVYATVATNYLTTAMQSGASSAFAGTGFTSATTAGTAIVATHNTAGLSMGIPAFLTTAGAGGGAGNIVSISGNTTGTANTYSSGTMVFAGGNNITLSQSSNSISFNAPQSSSLVGGANITISTTGNTISIIGGAGGAGGGIALGAGSQTATSGTVAFANSNGISFGMSGSNQITASYTVPTQSQQPMYYSGANGSGSASTLTFANSNGVSFSTGTQGVYATVATNYQSQGAYLTTAMVSNAGSNFIGLNSALTGNGVSATINSSGISLNVPAFLTTAMQSGASSAFAGTGFTSASTAGVAIVATHNTAGLSMGVPAYLTTYAAQTAQPVAYSAANGSANFSTLTFANSNGVSFSSGTQGLYATVATNYLTTAMASNYGSNFAGLGTTFAGTNVSASMTMGSAGLNLALSAGAGGGGGGNVVSISGNTTGTANTYSSGTMVFAGGNNITLSQSSNTISIIGAGVSGGQSQQPMYYSAANGSGSASTMVFADSNGVSFSTGTQGVYATVATSYLTTAMASNYGSNFAGLGTTFAGTNVTASMTMGSAGLNLALSAGTGTLPWIRDWQVFPMAASSMTSIASGSLFLCPVQPAANISFTAVEQVWSNGIASTATAAGWSKSMSFSYGLYAEGAGTNNTRIELLSSSSVGLSVTGSSNVSIAYTFGQGATTVSFSSGASAHSYWNAQKIMTLPFAGTMAAGGLYFFAQHISTATAGFNPAATWSQMLNAEATNASFAGFIPGTINASNKSQIQEPYGFILSVSTAAFPAAMAYSDASVYSNYQPFLYFEG